MRWTATVDFHFHVGMRTRILAGFVLVTVLLSASAADNHSTIPVDQSISDTDTDTSIATINDASSVDLTDMAEDGRGPLNVAPSSRAASFEGPPPTVPGISEESVGTSSLVLGVIRANPDDSEAGYSQRDVVVIAVCVSLLSLTVVILSVAMTFLIRRRMRQKAYLRVKHASQTELSVHYVQNTPASAAARDLVMGQLFESLASMDAERTNDFQIAYSSDDQCLSPTESIGSELVNGKDRMYSRSMPSLKNLNAHEEALNCHFSFVPSDAASGKRKGRSRSFTEKTIYGVGVGMETARGKSASRSHSEKSKHRLAVVSLLTPKKRFEKKRDKSNRRSTPSFSRFARFNILRGQSSKQKATDAREQSQSPIPCNDPRSAAEQAPLTRITSESDAKDVTSSDLEKCYNTSLSDFELPNVSPIMQEMKPMLAALRMNGSGCKFAEDDDDDEEVTIFREIPPSNRLSNCTDKAASLEEVVGEYFRRKGKASAGAGKESVSTRQTKPSQTSLSVNDLDAMRTTVV